MAKQKRPKIHFEYCQFKSIEKVRLLAKLLDTMEKEFGIKEVNISFLEVFVCPDIDLFKLYKSKKPMERIVAQLLMTIHFKKYGKKSKYIKEVITK